MSVCQARSLAAGRSRSRALRREAAGPADMTSRDYMADSSGHYAVHEEALKDEARVVAYQAAILHTVQCTVQCTALTSSGYGSGLLCMLAAQPGDAMVIGVDYSAIADTGPAPDMLHYTDTMIVEFKLDAGGDGPASEHELERLVRAVTR